LLWICTVVVCPGVVVVAAKSWTVRSVGVGEEVIVVWNLEEIGRQ